MSALAEGRTEGSAHMSEGPSGYRDSRPDGEGPDSAGPEGSPAAWYPPGLGLLSRGTPAPAAQILERAATVEPSSRSVREALARAQFDARRYTEAADNFRLIVEASPTDDYAHFGLGPSLARARGPGPGPVAGPVGGPGVGRGVPGAGRGHAAEPEALHRCPASGPRYAALPGRPE